MYRGGGLSRIGVLCACTASLLVCAVGISQRSATWMDVDTLKPGMRGWGLSVFRGIVPEKFEAELIGVLHNFRPNRDLILIRTPHPLLNRARTVGGMSGSPIYINGRLIGAYAYGWAFGADPVIGVTPIRSMLAELQRKTRLEAFPGATPLGNLSYEPKAAEPEVDLQHPRFAGLPPYRGRSTSVEFTSEMHRESSQGFGIARTPVMTSGMSEASARWLEEKLKAFGIETAQTGSGGRTHKKPAPAYVPGGAIAIQLMQGDISANGTGTITHVAKDGRVLAFGHPMIGAGELGFPTAPARIVHLLISNRRSFKIGEALQTRGTLVQDRPSTIIVEPKLKAALIPVHIRIEGVPDAPKKEWNVEVASHRNLTPFLILSAISSAIDTTAGTQDAIVYEIESQLHVEGHGIRKVSDKGFSEGGRNTAKMLSDIRLIPLIEATIANPFETTFIRGVNIRVRLTPGRARYTLVDASSPQSEVDPGSKVRIDARLLEMDGSEITRALYIDIPNTAAGRTVEINLQPGNKVKLQRPQPVNLDGLFAEIEREYPSTSLVASILLPAPTLKFRKKVAHSLPSSAFHALRSSALGKPSFTFHRVEFPMDQITTGHAKIMLRVRSSKKDAND